MNDTTFQGDGKIVFVPVVVNAKQHPQSNADRIRAMTDEEMAIEETSKGGCPHDCEMPDDLDTDCVRCWLDWLKQEVDNDG